MKKYNFSYELINRILNVTSTSPQPNEALEKVRSLLQDEAPELAKDLDLTQLKHMNEILLNSIQNFP